MYFRGISCNVSSSFLILFIWILFLFFSVILAKRLLILFIFYKKPILIFLLFCCVSDLFFFIYLHSDLYYFLPSTNFVLSLFFLKLTADKLLPSSRFLFWINFKTGLSINFKTGLFLVWKRSLLIQCLSLMTYFSVHLLERLIMLPRI